MILPAVGGPAGVAAGVAALAALPVLPLLPLAAVVEAVDGKEGEAADEGAGEAEVVAGLGLGQVEVADDGQAQEEGEGPGALMQGGNSTGLKQHFVLRGGCRMVTQLMEENLTVVLLT